MSLSTGESLFIEVCSYTYGLGSQVLLPVLWGAEHLQDKHIQKDEEFYEGDNDQDHDGGEKGS